MRFSILFFLSIFLFSCSEQAIESDFTNAIPDIEPAEYLETYVQNPIIFQYSKVNRVAESVSGWVITKDGDVKLFSTSLSESLIGLNQVPTATLTEFYNSLGEPVASVDLAELKDMYSLNLISPRFDLSDDISAEEITEIYSSYVLTTQYTTWRGNEECPVHHDPFANSNSFKTPSLLVNDKLHSMSPYSKNIYSWLKEVSIDVPTNDN